MHIKHNLLVHSSGWWIATQIEILLLQGAESVKYFLEKCGQKCFYMLLPSISCSFLFSHFQVAIIAGNFDLAEIIKVHKASDVGKLTAVVITGQLCKSRLGETSS